MPEDKILQKISEHDGKLANILTTLSEHNKKLANIAITLSEHDEKLTNIATVLDGAMTILQRLDQERIFTIEWVRRIEKEVDSHREEINRIKLQLKIV